jgi:hypothetical protein
VRHDWHFLREVPMASRFELAHRGDLLGSLTTVDRLIVHGHLSRLWYADHMAYLLDRLGVHILRDFGRFVKGASDRVIDHAVALAKKAGRPFIYQNRVVKGKDELARQIAARDGVTEGLICVFSTVETAMCFALAGGAIRPRLRKCLHLYFYLIDRELGFMHVRLQTWFPFQIQVYLNGHEWLARQLERQGVGFDRYENTFLQINDPALAERLCARFIHRRWSRLFDAFARRINPWLGVIRQQGFGSYYWCIDACEVSTDLMWSSRRLLLATLDDLFDHAIRAFSADDVVRFLGLKHRPKTADVETRHARRPEGRRIKHRVRHNWLKLYDKWSVLRVETVINNPADFRVPRFEHDRRGHRHRRWMPMNKGVCNLWRYVHIGEANNRRYLDALAEVTPTGKAIAQLDSLCRPRSHQGQHFPRFNPVSRSDAELFEALLSGEHLISGLANRDIQRRLWTSPPKDPADARRRCQRVYRLIRKLRGHGILAKIPSRRRYRLTLLGRRLLAAAIHYRQRDFPHALAA